jgi:anaerobic C4-dicarboxylate transporter
MNELLKFCRRWLKTNPEQIQIFSPTPSTISTLMYCTGKDMNGNPVWSEHSMDMKQKQKDIIIKPERKSDSSQVKGKGRKKSASIHSSRK